MLSKVFLSGGQRDTCKACKLHAVYFDRLPCGQLARFCGCAGFWQSTKTGTPKATIVISKLPSNKPRLSTSLLVATFCMDVKQDLLAKRGKPASTVFKCIMCRGVAIHEDS